MKRLRWPWVMAWMSLVAPGMAWACSVCYGEPDSPVSQGLTWAITALGAIVMGVLAGCVAFFVQASRKAALLEAAGPAPVVSQRN